MEDVLSPSRKGYPRLVSENILKMPYSESHSVSRSEVPCLENCRVAVGDVEAHEDLESVRRVLLNRSIVGNGRLDNEGGRWGMNDSS